MANVAVQMVVTHLHTLGDKLRWRLGIAALNASEFCTKTQCNSTA